MTAATGRAATVVLAAAVVVGGAVLASPDPGDAAPRAGTGTGDP